MYCFCFYIHFDLHPVPAAGTDEGVYMKARAGDRTQVSSPFSLFFARQSWGADRNVGYHGERGAEQKGRRCNDEGSYVPSSNCVFLGSSGLFGGLNAAGLLQNVYGRVFFPRNFNLI